MINDMVKTTAVKFVGGNLSQLTASLFARSDLWLEIQQGEA